MKHSIAARLSRGIIALQVVAFGTCSLAQGAGIDVKPKSLRVVERGPNHSVVQRLTAGFDENGNESTRTNSWIQLEDGLNYWDTDIRDWAESTEAITLDGVGAVAARGQHRVLFSPDANDPAGAVDFEVNRQARFRASLLALRYFDPISGQHAVIAMAQNSPGELLPPNQVIYRDVLDGVKASLVFTYRKSGLESDLVLHEIPPSPAEYGFPPEVARIEVVTEFFEAPAPTKRFNFLDQVTDPNLRDQVAVPDWIDEELDFGDNRMGPGRAFAWSEREAARVHPESFPSVGKQWIRTEDGRQALIESVDYVQLLDDLANLPGTEARRTDLSGLSRKWAKSTPPHQRLKALSPQLAHRTVDPTSRTNASQNLATRLPTRQFARGGRVQAFGLHLAQANAPLPKGLVLDWTSVSSGSADMVFRADETYLVTGQISLTGTNVLEGGTVIKFPKSTNNALYSITIYSAALLCKTTSYRPAIFTAEDDNSVGESIRSGTPDLDSKYAHSPLIFNNTQRTNLIENVRFKHSYWGIYFLGQNPLSLIRHCQFQNCWYPVANTTNTPIRLQNSSIQIGPRSGGTIFWGYSTPFVGEHLTLRNATHLCNADGLVTLTNCLAVGITNIQTHTAINSLVLNTIPAGTFVGQGAGEAYLPLDSPHRNAGTTNIDSSLAAVLRTLTTDSPTLLSGSVYVPTTLHAQARPDYDLPDLGYHYPAIDYLVSGLMLSNTSLTIGPGATVAAQGNSGFILQASARLSLRGTPASPARLVRYNCVQEGMDPTGTASGSAFDFVKIDAINATGPAIPSIDIRGAYISHLAINTNNSSARTLLQASASSPVQPLSISHSELRGVYLNNNGPVADNRSITLTNNLFQNCIATFNDSSGNASLSLDAYNNLLLGSTLTLQNWGPTTWALKDNLFASSRTTTNGNGQYLFAHNGFSAGISPLGTNNKTNLTLDFVSGPLGPFYYPTNGSSTSLSSLFDAGSRSREAAGLFHFTTKPLPGSKEGLELSPTVDIGYHYAATDASGRPIDTDGDGLPDALEDSNGNGLPDPGESNWTTSPNTAAGPAALQVHTPLR